MGYLNRDLWTITYDHLTNLLSLLDTQQMKDSLQAFLQKESNKAS